MKLVKIFGIVMAFHAAAFMFIFAIPGCRSTSKKKPVATASVTGEASPVASAEAPASPVASSEIAAVRFSPTRPGTPAAAEVTGSSAATTYVVAKGDNLWSIAKKSGVTVKQLAVANKIGTDTPLKLGQKLIIPAAKSAPTTSVVPAAPAVSVATATAAPATSKAALIHIIKTGDTLGSIAKKYQVKVGDIALANNIADPTKIRVGQTLKIPGAKPAAPVATPTAVPAAAPKFAPEPAPSPAPAPASPLFASPVEAASAPPAGASPFVTPAPQSEVPVIRVEE